jgi:hypothetical protein
MLLKEYSKHEITTKACKLLMITVSSGIASEAQEALLANVLLTVQVNLMHCLVDNTTLLVYNKEKKAYYGKTRTRRRKVVYWN